MKLKSFAALMATAGLTAAAGASAAPADPVQTSAAPEGADDDREFVLAADAERGIAAAQTAGTTAGATAERARWNAVLTSDEGKANAPMATFMLNHTPDAKAEDIIAQLKTAPAAAAPAAAPAAAAPAAPAGKTPEEIAAETGALDTSGGRSATGAKTDGDPGGTDTVKIFTDTAANFAGQNGTSVPIVDGGLRGARRAAAAPAA